MSIFTNILNILKPKNNIPKIFALILAIMFWFYIKSEENITITKTVTPSINVNESMVVLETSSSIINIQLSGRKEDVEAYKDKRIKAVIDLSSYTKKMSINMPLKRTFFQLPPHLDISGMNPHTIEVVIDKLEEKVLPVNVKLGGEIGSDHIIENTYTNPRYVSVTGAKSILDKLKAIDTIPLDITGRVKSFSQNIQLTNLRPSTKTKEVQVFVNITEQLSERTFPNIPIKTLIDPKTKHNVRIDPPTAEVILKGSKKTIETLTAQEIDIVIGTADLTTGSYELPLRVLPIRDVHIKEIKPKVVNVGINTDQTPNP